MSVGCGLLLPEVGTPNCLGTSAPLGEGDSSEQGAAKCRRKVMLQLGTDTASWPRRYLGEHWQCLWGDKYRRGT